MDNSKINFNDLTFIQKFNYVKNNTGISESAETKDIVNEIVKLSKENIKIDPNKLTDSFTISKAPQEYEKIYQAFSYKPLPNSPDLNPPASPKGGPESPLAVYGPGPDPIPGQEIPIEPEPEPETPGEAEPKPTELPKHLKSDQKILDTDLNDDSNPFSRNKFKE